MGDIHDDLREVMGLLPCPFCGGRADYDGSESRGYQVKCQTCGVRGRWGDYGYQALAAWNTRPALLARQEGEDAERYRWLKENCQHAPDEYGTAGQLYFGTYAGGELDAAIDVARSGGGG